jgi:beta-mannosidase
VGINFLRVWGGGIREKRAFWERCNEIGVMAMQEFPLACAFLDHYPRHHSYLALLEGEVRGVARLLRNHASLIAWCGGNEISPRRERLPLRSIERVLGCEDPARPWIPASPSGGDVHQWDVWHGAAPWQALSRATAPFMSEFGLQALPQRETVEAMFPSGAPQSLDDGAWRARKLQVEKLRHYARPLAEADLVPTIEATQRTQSAGLQAGIEACRLRREGSGHRHACGGVAFWQFNEPWPVVSWSVIDRLGRPKEAFEMLARCYQPLLVAARFERRPWRAGEQFTADIWLVNDGPHDVSGCRVQALLDGREVYACDAASVGPSSARRLGALSVKLDQAPSSLGLFCRRDGEDLAQNRYDLGVYLPPRQPLTAWLMRRITDLLLR